MILLQLSMSYFKQWGETEALHILVIHEMLILF